MGKRLRVPYKIYKRGNYFWAYFTIQTADGETSRFRISTGKADAREAESFCVQKITELQLQKKRKQGELPCITLSDAFDLFYDKHAQYYARPTETLRKLILIKNNLPIKYLHELDSSELSDYIQRRKSQVSNGTINREIVIISSLISKCRLWKYQTSDLQPCKFKLKEKAENVKYLADWEVAQKIIDNAPKHLKPIIYTALYTGLRRSNILNLKWSELDFKNELISVKVKDRTKEGGKNLTIPMIDKLKSILQAQPKINEFVFNYNKHPIKDCKHAWHSIFYDKDGNLRDSTLQYTNFHTLRHTAATWILKTTGNLKLTQEILGHASITTTLKYAHVLSDEKRKALDSVFG